MFRIFGLVGVDDADFIAMPWFRIIELVKTRLFYRFLMKFSTVLLKSSALLGTVSKFVVCETKSVLGLRRFLFVQDLGTVWGSKVTPLQAFLDFYFTKVEIASSKNLLLFTDLALPFGDKTGFMVKHFNFLVSNFAESASSLASAIYFFSGASFRSVK